VELKPSSQGVDALAEALRATYVQNGVPVDWDRAWARWPPVRRG